MRKIIWILLSGILLGDFLYATLPDFEQWAEHSEEDTQFSLLAEQLEVWQSHPPDLNAISLSHLTDFPLLSTDQAKKIIENRRNEGLFKSWKDFKKRIRYTSREVKILSTYFTLQTEPAPEKINLKLSQQITRTFPLSRGYKEQKYRGSPLKCEQRIDCHYSSRLLVRYILQKDPGEKNWTDHQSGFAEIHPSQWIDKLIIGNYYLQSGHGLVLSAPYRRSPAWQTVEFMQMPSQTLHGLSSGSENTGFSGLAIQSSLGRFKSYLFISKVKRDATVYKDNRIESINMSGLHRSASEMQKRKTVTETTEGIQLSWQSSKMDLGLTTWQNCMSRPFKYHDHEKHFYDFTGFRNRVIGMNWNIHWQSLLFSGEYAKSRSGGTAILQSVSYDSKSFKWSLGFRTVTPDFHNPYGPFDSQNIQALYLAARWQRFKNIKADFYTCHARHPWRTFFNPMPSQNHDWMIRINWHFLPKTDFKMHFKYNSSETFETVHNAWQIPAGYIFPVQTEGFRIEVQGEAATQINYKIRVEQKRYLKDGTAPLSEKSRGWLCFYQLKYGNPKFWQCILRWTSFATDTYDSRIYTYEPDLPGVFHISPYYLSGTSTLLVFHFGFRKILSFHLKYKTIYHDSVESWGSGYDQINSNQIHYVGFQMNSHFQ